MKPLLNLDEPVQRRTGEPAEIIKRDALGHFCVIALITHRDGSQFPKGFTLRGSCATDHHNSDNDLINVPKRVEDGALILTCYLQEDGEIVMMKGHASVGCAYGAIGAKTFHLVVKRGEWV